MRHIAVTVSFLHSTQATGNNNGSKQLSVTAWNEEHDASFTHSLTSAVARDLGEKLEETASIFDFLTSAQRSAIIAGTSTDDTTLIQTALDACSGKAKLRFPKGSYRVNTASNTMPFPWYGGLRVPSNSHLIFDPGATFYGIANDDPKTMIFSLYDVDNVIISGANIVGDRESHTYPNLFDTLADLNAGDYRTWEEYSETFTPYEGMEAVVYQDGGNTGKYTYSGGAWGLTGAYSALDYVTHEFGYGICIYNSRNVWIDKCRIADCTGDGIYIGEETNGPSDTFTRRVFITGCDIEGHRRQGISIVQGSDILITGNSFRDIGLRQNLQDGMAPRSGIDIESGTYRKSTAITITGNIFQNCTGGSFINYDGDNVTFGGNVCVGYGISYGYGVNSTYIGNTIMGGVINGNGGRTAQAFTYTQSGTVVTATFASAHSLVDGQKFYYEFYDANSRVVHSGHFTTTVTSTTVVTVDVGQALTLSSGNGARGFPNNNSVIEGNTILDGNINIVGKGMAVRGNTITNYTEGFPIYVGNTSADVLVQGNVINGGTIGISGVVGATGVKIDGNIVKNCTAGGIRTYTTGAITNNRITNCLIGIDARDAAAHISNNYIDLSGYTGASYSINLTGNHRHEVAGNTIANAPNVSIFCASPALIMNNRIRGFTGTIGIQVNGTTANGARVINNYVETSRASIGAVGIVVNGSTDGARLIGNTLVSTSSAYTNAIDTSGGANTRITNNVYMATINSAGTDTLTTNVAY